MRRVQYGSRVIEYSVLEKEGLKSHYITVERHVGVVLKGKHVPAEKAEQMILKKAPWILGKLETVGAVQEDAITTGSRMPYLGKSYYVEIIPDPGADGISIEFNHSKFKIYVPSTDVQQNQIRAATEAFYKAKAVEKIAPRVEQLSSKTNLPITGVSFRKMKKRWGSCTAENKIIINTDSIKLPFTLIDYLVVHELCHTKVKDHSKAFWAELSKHAPNWKVLDERIKEMKM
jgi:hypothetical protein